MSATLLSWLTGAVLLFWAIGAYNRLMRLRSQAAQGFGILDERLRQLVAQVQAHPLAHASGPQGSGLDAAATQLEAALRQARIHPFDVAQMQVLATAYGTLAAVWVHVQGTTHVEAPPPAAEPMGRPWHELALQVEAARGEFNQRIAQYNAAVRQFPAVVLARMLGLKTAQEV